MNARLVQDFAYIFPCAATLFLYLTGMQTAMKHPAATIPFREALYVWLKVALLSFGGPAGQIAVMHRLLVEEKGWISEARFLHALNYCMLLPGPEAQQLAIYLGWLLHRTLGGVVAGVLFILPGFLAILALSMCYALYQGAPLLDALFYGLKPAVLAIVLQAGIKIGRKVLANAMMIGFAAAAFTAIFFFNVPFPLIIVLAALTGWAGGTYAPRFFPARPAATHDSMDSAIATPHHLTRSLRVLMLCLGLWFAPLLLIGALAGLSTVFFEQGLFFSKMAVVTFGGAYAALTYVAQQAVERYGWLAPGEMLDGLGMAETTPGPLIQVVQFVGFMGAYRNPGMMDPLMAGLLASFIVTWVTFVPCFLWIFLGAPYIEKLRGNAHLSHALAGITAAVVGVILNLALWFASHSMFSRHRDITAYGLSTELPIWSSVDPVALALTLLCLIAMLVFRLGMLWTLLLSVCLGLIYHLFANPAL